MLAAIRSAAVLGIDAYDVTVEVDATQGLPQWTIVGLPLGAVKESRERVGSALVNSGFTLPPRRITINLAPADVRKDGTAFDLPIALGILVATGQLPPDAVEGRVFVGELGLDGSVRSIRGALPIARRTAVRLNSAELVLPLPNVGEAARVTALRLAAPESLRSLASELVSGSLSGARNGRVPQLRQESLLDFADVVGQQTAKRALEVAAAGGHNLCMTGPPDVNRKNL
ncbi:MAG: ATP-binding protein [Gemmatimonadota bacterium]|nr:ATP-binding protein [Gemmatimonadota bacterium]